MEKKIIVKKEKRCLICAGYLVENVYHRAKLVGAKYYCGFCDMHLNVVLHAVRIRCSCCGFDDKKTVDKYNQIAVKKYIKT